MDPKKPDPEMLKALDLLIDLDSLESESDWEVLLNLDQAQTIKADDTASKSKQQETK